MFNPFEEFRAEYIDRLIRMEKFYLVSQTYARANDHFTDSQVTNMLLTDYDDIEYARIHKQALQSDKLAAIIDLRAVNHKDRLMQLLEPGSGYKVWFALVKNVASVNERMNNKYTAAIRRYINSQTNWRIGSSETIKPSLECIFGELFVILKYRKDRIKIPLSDLEKF